MELKYDFCVYNKQYFELHIDIGYIIADDRSEESLRGMNLDIIILCRKKGGNIYRIYCFQRNDINIIL